MMNVYLLEQTEEDVPQSNNWLSERERNHLRTLNFLKRRTEWRLGRWTAKLAVAALQNVDLDADLLSMIEIHPAPSGAPRVLEHELRSDLTISISHRSGMAICAIAAQPVRLGCDLEIIEPHSAGFVSDYFTLEEQDLIEGAASTDRWSLVNMLWSAKESALKALQEGLRRDTRSVVVRPGSLSFGEHWASLQVHSLEGDRFYGWSREMGGTVITVVADDHVSTPIRLQAPNFRCDRQHAVAV